MFDFGRVFRQVAPVVMVAMAGGLAGCDGVQISINDEKGKTLSELDLTGAAPTELNLLGPDLVKISTGEKLEITVEGAAADHVRFSLDDGSLSILREDDSWSDNGTATINVTMPAPTQIVLAGSGTVESATLAKSADINIAGSGTVETPEIAVEKLTVNILGSGSYSAGGTADNLDLNIAGSGDASMAGLKIGKADINIAGSGDAELNSDGEVQANLMGSGNVTVTGRATCKMNGFGSGTLTCQSGETSNSDDASG